MLRDLLVRVSAGLLSAAIAVSCAHTEDKPTEQVGVVDQALTPGGAGGLPAVGAGGAADAAGGAGQPATCDVATCEAPGTCTHCVANACVNYAAGDNHECRTKADLCDVAEVCQGAATCPADAVVAKDVQCRVANGKACDVADVCDGKTVVCADAKQPKSFVCNDIKPGSLCDQPEYCAGGDDCPADTYADGTVLCRSKKNGCDVDDYCTGKGPDCPADAKAGDGADCSDNPNKCLQTTKCLAGVCTGGTTKTCNPDTTCVNAGTCNTTTGNCDYVNKAPTTPCDDKIACTVGDHCSNGACIPGIATDNVCPKRVCAAVTCDISGPALQQFPDGCKIAPVPAGANCRNVAVGDTCDVVEKCDGASPDCPADLKALPGTQCVAAACTTVAGQASSQVKLTCNGTDKTCPVATPVSCNGFACNGTVCATTCTDDSSCQDDHYCVNGVCEARTSAGQTCKNDTECSKSNPKCVDGVCCNVACTGQCEACDVKGQEGTCSPVTGDPHSKRTACRGDGSSCNGTCAGKLRSSCDFPDPQTVCQDAACDAKTGMAVEQAFCDGAGNCATTDAMDCTPFTCGATACRGNCVTDAQCIAGAFCKAGVCVDLEKPGGKCARDGQCGSGFCTDGVCCEARCDGQCESCGGGGKCQPTVGEPAGMRAACTGDTGDACAGTCDGTSSTTCAYPAGEIVCRDAACDAGTATVVAHCTGGGACAAQQTVACKNGCEGTICAGDACTVNADCKAGEQCLAGTCAPQGGNGASCSAASDCGSGFCVDGVCCDSACDGQCEACDGGKKAGTCAPISGAPHGGRVQCTSDGSACAGACDGKEPSGCSYPSGTVCAAGSCSPGKDGAEAVATVEAACNGSGRCPAARDQACGGVGCDAKQQQCNGDCADGTACGKGQYCSAGVCVTTAPTGTACQAATDCASGFCVDGYCCSTACADRCAACDVPGSLGECSPVTGSTHGGRPGCEGGGACGSQCDGKSVTDCAFPDKTTACAAAYCNSGVSVAASTCDGAGQCKEGEPTACASFACDGTQCSAACKTNADCTRTFQCHEGECVPPYKIDAKDQGTCGCRAPGSRPTSNGGWLALVAVSLFSLRRRRPTSRSASASNS